MRHVVVGTAGHIDHGKSSLVRALTGVDPDRLPEERARGITIDLGFSYLRATPELTLGIVDVPGHERFVKNMVAGAGGLDLVMMVIAADEGVMPQTREHKDICQLLGVQRGLVVLTKVDLVEREWLALVHDDVERFVKGSLLEGAPRLEVSTKDGRGLDALRAALVQLANALPARPEGGLTRLPVDRVFTLPGFGTVATGTLASGRLSVGDTLVAVPGGARGKVRGLHAYGAEVAQARAGMRTAVNLQGTERSALSRGDVLALEGTLLETTHFDADVFLLGNVRRPLPSRAPLLLHLGTAQSMAHIVLLDRDALAPGESAPAQLRLEQPVAAMPGDRFILRGFEALDHYGRTVGGGVILDAHPPRYTRKGRAAALPALNVLRKGTTAERVAVLLRRAGHEGLTPEALAQRLPFSGKELERAMGELLERGQALRFDRVLRTAVHAEVVNALRESLVAEVRAHHAQHPERPGVPREELRARVDPQLAPKLFAILLQQLERELASDGELVRAVAHRAALNADAGAVSTRLTSMLEAAGLAPPNVKELALAAEAAPEEVLAALTFLAQRGEVVRVRADLYFARSAVDGLATRLVAYLREHGEINTQGFKELAGVTRKWAIPLQEHFDETKLTLRVGDKRLLRARVP